MYSLSHGSSVLIITVSCREEVLSREWSSGIIVELKSHGPEVDRQTGRNTGRKGMVEGLTRASESQVYLTVHVQIHNLPQFKYQQLLRFMFERAKVGDAVE
jgi:hypothetical protein